MDIYIHMYINKIQYFLVTTVYLKLILFKNLFYKGFILGLMNSLTFLTLCGQNIINYIKFKHCESLGIFFFFYYCEIVTV